MLSTARNIFLFIILKLLDLLTNIPDNHPYNKPYSKPYRKIIIDPLPVVKSSSANYKTLLELASQRARPIKPVKSRSSIPKSLSCKFCGAPYNYIYSNGNAPLIKNKRPLTDKLGKSITKRQFQCKVCKRSFHLNSKNKSPNFFCPFCLKPLDLYKQRSDFNLYKCRNKSCSYRLHRIYELDKTNPIWRDDPNPHKISYLFREFKFSTDDLVGNPLLNPKVHFLKIHSPVSVICLGLTLYINYGMSLRETSRFLKEVFGVEVSHATINNWVNTCSHLLKPFFDNYTIQVSKTVVTDETYIKIKGKWGYVFISYDLKKHRIISIIVSLKRDTFAASNSMFDVIKKTNNSFEELVTDGNPIYQLAHQFFVLKDISYYKHIIVKGLSNDDEVSRIFRNFKQGIERVIETFKRRYRRFRGFKSLNGAISFCVLFGIWFNFLRPHETLRGNFPIELPQLKDFNVIQKWGKLFEMALYNNSP